jgi:hypothetical protein
LESVDLKSADAVSQLQKIISTQLRNLPIFLTDLKVNERVVRARFIDEKEGFHKQIKDYSYNPYPDKVKIGRANLESQQIFYGSRYRVTALGEVKFIYANRMRDYAHYSLGGWDLVGKLDLAAIVLPGEIRKHNAKELFGLADFIEGKANELKNDPVSGGLLEVYEYMSMKFREPIQEGEEHKYTITAVFSDFIYSKLKIADGLLYQSVQYPENFNIALKKEVIDNNKLQLMFAVRQKFERTCHLEYKEVDSIQATNIDLNTAIITWP